MSRASDPPSGVVAMVCLRANNCCERCGRSVVDFPADKHHRRPRGSGGTSGERLTRISQAAYIVLLCRDCHHWVETNRKRALVDGWLLREIQRAEEVTLTRADGSTFTIDNDGNKCEVTA